MNAPPLRLHNMGSQLTTGKRDLPGLNCVRAIAALGVVLLHACVPYLEHPMPGLQWATRDAASTPVDFMFWSIEVFIMPVFLVLAGFFAWQTLLRKGHGFLVASRARRLLVPLLFGMVVVLPIDLYIWIAGWIADGLVSPVKIKSLKFDGALGENIWGLSHLWFLLYLFLYIAITSTAAWVVRESPRLDAMIHQVAGKHAWSLVVSLFLTATLTLIFRPEVVWGFQHAFAPVPSKWIYSGTFFAGGLLLGYADPNLDKLPFHAPRLFSIAVLFLAAAVFLGRWHLRFDAAHKQATSPLFAQTILALVTTSGAALMTLSVIGLSVRLIHRNGIRIQYLAAASFWIYLVHHPLLGLAHIDLKWCFPTLSPVIKTLLAFAVSVTVSLLLYEAFIRQTRLGKKLGFAWSGPQTNRPSPTRQRLPAERPPLAA